jgi:hypothetical protein
VGGGGGRREGFQGLTRYAAHVVLQGKEGFHEAYLQCTGRGTKQDRHECREVFFDGSKVRRGENDVAPPRLSLWRMLASPRGCWIRKLRAISVFRALAPHLWLAGGMHCRCGGPGDRRGYHTGGTSHGGRPAEGRVRVSHNPAVLATAIAPPLLPLLPPACHPHGVCTYLLPPPPWSRLLAGGRARALRRHTAHNRRHNTGSHFMSYAF